MAKKKVGLYLGVSSVGVALKAGRKPVSLGSADISSVEAKEEEALDQNLHWQALIRKSLRQANIEAKEVYLSLTDRDFIIRSLELPAMGKAELDSALIYEVEKYIPFKPEELVWDYQYDRIPKEKKVRVCFVGIRKSSLARVKKILHYIDLEALTVEPACLSLVRMIKTSKQNAKVENFVLLDFISQEVYLTFFQNDLPVFNRHLSLREKDGKLDVDSFIEAVNFSFQYFQREFKASKLDKVFFVAAGPELEEIASSLEETVSLPVEKLSPHDLTSNQQASVECIKALGCLEREESLYRFKPVLRSLEDIKEAEPLPASEVPWRWGMLIGVAVSAVLVFFASTVFFNNSLSRTREEFRRRESLISLPEELRQAGWQNIEPIITRKQGRVRSLENFKRDKVKLAGFLKVLGQEGVLPDSLWLDSLRLGETREGERKIDIVGYSYEEENAYQERQAIDEFVLRLRKEESVVSLFSFIEVPYVRRRELRDFLATEFSMELR